MKKFYLLLAAATATIVMTGCANLEGKSFAASGGVDAVKIETSGSTSTGTILPNITLGGAVSAIADSPAVENGKSVAPVFAKAQRNSFFGELFGLNCATTAITYIGTPGETAEQTALRMKAISEVAEVNAQSADSAASAETTAEDVKNGEPNAQDE